MTSDSIVLPFRQPGDVDDPLTSILRDGARRVLAEAIEMEAETFLASMRTLKLADGRDRLVRHGHGPERTIQTGIGAVKVSRVKLRDRGAAATLLRLVTKLLTVHSREMAARRTLTVSMTAEQDALVRICMQSGRSASASEVVRAALRLLGEREQQFQLHRTSRDSGEPPAGSVNA